ncbi:MAG: GNAT family protein, partial [Gammaproteobacteria bacterium]
LVNALLDATMAENHAKDDQPRQSVLDEKSADYRVEHFPLTSTRLKIRLADSSEDAELLSGWMGDEYGRHFLLSCASAQKNEISALTSHHDNRVGIIQLPDETPIGAVAYLDINQGQRRAELRKLIGDRDQRGKGFAEEATKLWLAYGLQMLGLQKIYVSTLQTHIRNIKLNESIGFRVEGVLRGEVLLNGERHDVLRMGLCA